MRKIFLILIFLYYAYYVVAQDTIIYRHEAMVKDPLFFSMMDSVEHHIDECIFIKEVPFCIFVRKYNLESTYYYEFTTMPLNNSVLWSYETMFPRNILYPYRYKSLLFLFSFNDEKVGISHCLDTIQIDTSSWVKYLYIKDEDNPELILPIQSVETFTADTYTLYRRKKCVDISSKKRIINTIHTKLFL